MAYSVKEFFKAYDRGDFEKLKLKIFLILCIIPSFVFSTVTLGQGQKLDELLLKSGKIRQEGVRGFFVQNKEIQKNIPNKNLEEFSKTYSAPEAQPAQPIVNQYVPYSMYLSDVRRIDSLELQMTKMIAIMDNQVENAGTVKGSVELITKFMETFSGFIVALGSIIGWLKFRKKGKQNDLQKV